jgi:hypothetical protein
MIAYRTVMKLAHRFNWHYAPIIGPLQPGDGRDFQRWCQWCGFRQDFRAMNTPSANPKQAFVLLSPTQEADPE